MKRGDLCHIVVPPDAHPRDDYLHGMSGIIIGEPYKDSTNHEYIKCFLDRIRMIPIRWLEVVK